MNTSNDVEEIRALVEATSAAIRAKDVERALEPYTEDALFFDLAQRAGFFGVQEVVVPQLPGREAFQRFVVAEATSQSLDQQTHSR